MWWRSASFIMDRQRNEEADLKGDSSNPNPNPNISAYYETRAAHHGVVTSDWLAQAQAAIGPEPQPQPQLSPDPDKPFSVIDQFNSWRKQPHLAEAVAAIRALAAVIRSSQATTMMQLEIELKKASDSLKVLVQLSLSLSLSLSDDLFFFIPLQSWDTSSISLTAGCDLFMRYVTRTSALEYEDFNSAKSRLIERAEKFGEISYKATSNSRCTLIFFSFLTLLPIFLSFFLQARKVIAMLSQDFIFDGCTILVHGFSRVVFEVLKLAAQNNKLFRVFCTGFCPLSLLLSLYRLSWQKQN